MNASFDLDCPLCNGMESIAGTCPACGSQLQDGGMLENFFGPYSPYEEVEYELKAYWPEAGAERCIHLLYCPACGWDKRVGITKIPIE